MNLLKFSLKRQIPRSCSRIAALNGARSIAPRAAIAVQLAEQCSVFLLELLTLREPEGACANAPASWTAAVLCRYSCVTQFESGRGLPQSKTSPRIRRLIEKITVVRISTERNAVRIRNPLSCF